MRRIATTLRRRAPARHCVDATLCRIFYDPLSRPGWKRWARRRALEAALRLVHQKASRAREEQSQLAWQELGFKLRTLALFSQVDWVLSLKPHDPFTLPALVARARSLGPEEMPWVMEGIGQLVTQRLLAKEALPVDLLHDQDLPEWSLGTLHTGLGMALAVRYLAAVRRRDPDQSLARNVERFLTLCRRCSRPGYAGMAEECLGFVLRFLHPRHVAQADAILQESRPDLVAALWHGVGRALYFLPSNLLPHRSAPWRAISMAQEEAPHEVARQNMLAGLAWPFLLVTWQQPRILEAVLGHHAEQLHAEDCFSSGLGAAMVMWVDCTAGATRITDLLDHQSGSSRLATSWASLIREPCLEALTRAYPVLKKTGRMEEIFRYPLSSS